MVTLVKWSIQTVGHQVILWDQSMLLMRSSLSKSSQGQGDSYVPSEYVKYS